MQSLVALYVHVVFSTRKRRPVILSEMRQRLYAYFGAVLEAHGGRLLQAGGTEDHVHQHNSLGTQLSIAGAVRELKAKSSGWIHREFPRIKKFSWQGGYAGFSVSASNLDAVIRYIENQKEHHRRRSFREEIRALLQAHGVDFDEARFID